MIDDYPWPYGHLDDDDDSMTVASMTECTGLTPFSPYTWPEVDSFTDIYAVPLMKDEAPDLDSEDSGRTR